MAGSLPSCKTHAQMTTDSQEGRLAPALTLLTTLRGQARLPDCQLKPVSYDSYRFPIKVTKKRPC